MQFFFLFLLFLLPMSSVRSKKLQTTGQLYTLNTLEKAAAVPSYIVGPKSLVLRYSHDLKKAKDEHVKLALQVTNLESRPFLSAPDASDLQILKKKKLMVKDQIAKLSKRVAVGEPKSDLLKELGAGGYGKVMEGKCVDTNEDVAIKIASPEDYLSLFKENLLLSRLSQFDGFTKLFHFGEQHILEKDESHVVMVMEALGPSLDKLLMVYTLGTRGFNDVTVLKLADQLIKILQVLSTYNIVHNDIQPGNCLMGRGEKNSTVYIIDFGLAELSIATEEEKKKMFRGAFAPGRNDDMGESMIKGTLPFSSVAAMEGSATYEKDDLESLSYSLLYMLDNRLPWTTGTSNEVHNVDASPEAIIQNILKQKVSFRMNLREDMSSTTGGRNVIYKILEHSIQLSPDTKPDYEYLLGLVDDAIQQELSLKGGEGVYEWDVEGKKAVWIEGAEIELKFDCD